MLQTKGQLFGLPGNLEPSKIVILPVPLELTTSYGRGTSLGPQKIVEESYQLDLFHPDFGELNNHHFFFDDQDTFIANLQQKYDSTALACLEEYESFGKVKSQDKLNLINDACSEIHQYVFNKSTYYLKKGKIPCVLGGDHSSPLGLIKALCQKHREFSILHIDAHFDLRESYQGFTFSHASIMYNAHKMLPGSSSLTQVAIRDYCIEEFEYSSQHKNIHCFTDRDLQKELLSGRSWKNLTEDILSTLHKDVYISFDIDGLNPSLSPNTGTPVPGGLTFSQAQFLLSSLKGAGKSIIGFDLCEVSPGVAPHSTWDANVGARVLFELIIQALS